jgi:hypothetical protein
MRRLLLIALLALPACGGSDEELSRRPVREPAPAPDVEELGQQLRWPEDAGPPRNLEEDSIACQQQVESDPWVRRRSPLTGVRVFGKCLLDKGWVLVRREADEG